MRKFITTLVTFLFAVTLPLLAAPRVTLFPAAASARSIAVAQPQAATADDQKVVFNTHSLKYHCASCSAAKRCTKNCIATTLADAKARGGVACKLCGGTCAHNSRLETRPAQHIRCADGTLAPTCMI